MEKRNKIPESERIKKVVITGPESTGKTILAKQLADFYNTLWIPEYAREYLEKINRPYKYDDVVLIAKHQIKQQEYYHCKASNYLFYDTFLIITKIWLELVYKKCPDWVHNNIKNSNIDLFLLCDTDLPWEPDTLRENGGAKRQKLFEMYKQELVNYNFLFKIVKGSEKERFNNARAVLEEVFNS